MRLLVTGAAGFLGSHLCESLISKGHEVLGVDNLYTGSKDNLARILGNRNFEFLRHDVTFPLFVEVDGIMNLACPASPVHYQKHPVQTTKTSILGIVNMLGLAKRLSIPIFQASTSEVYGDPHLSPQTESYFGNVNPIGIRACYDEGKRVAETLMFDYQRQYNVDIKIVRIFNTYGPKMHLNDGRVVSNFIVQALRGEDITVYGDGNQTRSFCYVSDLISGFLKYFFSEEKFPGPINLGNPNEFTMNELANRVISLTGSKSKIKHLALPIDDPKKRRPDISLAERVLHWKPKIELDEGLKLTIKDFSERI